MEHCPNCHEETITCIGEAYDDEEYLGSSYQCLNCDFNFTITAGEETDMRTENFSTKL
jgi:transposase-like protein